MYMIITCITKHASYIKMANIYMMLNINGHFNSRSSKNINVYMISKYPIKVIKLL